MPNLAAVLKEEIRRLARKEARIHSAPLKKARTAERKAAAAMKRELAAVKQTLSRLTGDLRRQAKASGQATALESVESPGGKWRKDTVRSTRRMLDLTQSQLAKLIGVSPITVSFWETGRSTPREKQQAAVLSARALSKEVAHGRLGGAGGKRKPGPKPGKKSGKKARRKAGRKPGARRARSRKA